MALAALLGAAGTWGLAALARGLGWIDRREGLEDRKPREQPVPVVGGAAVLIAAALAAWITGGGGGLGQLPWVALVGAFVLGLVDDVLPGGLPARLKILGQVLVALLLALDPGGLHGELSVVEAFALAALAVVSMNAVNTWDHADGLTGGLSSVALLTGAPGLAGAVLGYLPLNTVIRQPVPRSRGATESVGAPRAMLGDSGSHFLGLALVAVPGAAWFLLVPLLDLARVARARIRRGQPFWVGDRTHIGHRVEALGFHPATGAAIVVATASPPLAAVGLFTNPVVLALGLLTSAALYGGLLAFTDLDQELGEEQGPGATETAPGDSPEAPQAGRSAPEGAAGPFSSADPGGWGEPGSGG